MTQGDDLRNRAVEILSEQPTGMRYAALVRALKAEHPAISVNAIEGAVYDLQRTRKDRITKPMKGLFLHQKFGQQVAIPDKPPEVPPVVPATVKESDFYEPFARWLEGEDECTKAVKVGGAVFRKKWDTPDVIGVWKAPAGAIIAPPAQLISAEIKTSSLETDLITGFGQCCAYMLFSHKVYLVVPTPLPDADDDSIDRIEKLCRIVGIGLVLFEATSVADPAWDRRSWATPHEPDPYYANQKAKEEIVRKLFD